MTQNKKSNEVSFDARSNFGARGWWVIIFSALVWAIVCFFLNVSMNLVVPAKAAVIGVDQGALLTWSTPAKLISLVATLLFSKLAEKKGVKLANGILLIGAAVFIAMWASSTTEATYAIGLILMYCFVSSAEVPGGNLLISNWFPRKKGIAMGWATMGAPLSSLVGASVLAGLAGVLGGIDKGLYVLAAFVFVIGILNFTTIKNYPEECGGYPDNDPTEDRREVTQLHTGWTWKKALKVKEIWFIAIGTGVLALSTTAFITTVVPTMIMKGRTEGDGLLALTIVSILGFAGSYYFGYIDQKFGTKKAVVQLSVWILIGILFFFIPGNASIWIFVALNGIVTGATNNFPLSMIAQVFGRDGSQVVFPVMFVIKGALIALSYGLMGQSLVHTGSYAIGWIAIAVLTVVAIILFILCNLTPRKDPIEE